MFPPGEYQFFFTFEYTPYISHTHSKITRDVPLFIRDLYFKDENRIETLRILTLNTISVWQENVLDKNFEPIPTCLPWHV